MVWDKTRVAWEPALDWSNLNSLWGSLLAETLAHLGLTTAVISPGSRSTPLTVALARHPAIDAVPVLDERSAAFFALGVAKRSGLPVVLVCTSGTAGANYLPAIIEAQASQVPLLVLTADRPPELRQCGSGQTIDQQKLYGDFVVWYAELAAPEPTLAMAQYLRQTLIQAWQHTLGPKPGPVHLNCPFRDPLAPDPHGPLPPDPQSPLATLYGAFPATTRSWFEAVRAVVPPQVPPDLPWADLRTERGIIVAGPAQGAAEPYCRGVAYLARRLGWPVLAEGLSPLRSSHPPVPNLVTTYDLVLRHPAQAATLVPDRVLQLGPLPTSKVLRQWLTQIQPRRWLVDETGRNLDPLHGPTQLVTGAVAALPDWADALSASQPEPSAYLRRWLALEQEVSERRDLALAAPAAPLEPALPWLLARTLPPHTPVVIANSMPIRDGEWFWPALPRPLRPLCNRGANGIDGTLSTALGVAHRHRPTVLLSGDLALLHDTNGWLVAAQLQGHLTVIVVNNGGGGIFERLPIAHIDPPFADYFVTPQRVDLAILCAAYGVTYQRVTSAAQLAELVAMLPPTGVRLLEVPSPRRATHQQREALLNNLGQWDGGVP